MHNKSAPLLVLAVVALTTLGLVILCSTGAYSGTGEADTYHHFKAQALTIGVGLVVCIAFALFPYRRLANFAPWLYGLGIVLLILCFFPPFGERLNGAARWISLRKFGLASVSMQPSEFARIAVMIAMATWFAYFARGERHEKTFRWGLLVPLLILGLPMGLILIETDIGAAALLGTVCLGMMFIAGTRLAYLIVIGATGLGGVVAAVYLVPNRMSRFLAFLDLEAHADGFGRQQWQGLLALANGGIFGQGLGNGEQKLRNLYASTSDFIFPMIGEEFGLIGTLGVVLAFVIIALCGLIIAFHAPDRFGQLLAFGIVSLVVTQSIINMGVTTGSMPNKGTPLPFVSAGGSNLVAYMICLGILINIYLQSLREQSGDSPAVAYAKLPPRL